MGHQLRKAILVDVVCQDCWCYYSRNVADSVISATSISGNQEPAAETLARHSLVVRVTHWITALCFFALLVNGVEILLSHPRFYLGVTGNVLSKPLFQLHVPSSRDMVVTGYNYVLPDQNGWSRYLHFEAAWFSMLAGVVYIVWGLLNGHFKRNLLPVGSRRDWKMVLLDHLHFRRSNGEAPYNPLQRLAYFCVVFLLFPLAIWTGLAMSPTVDGAFPWIGEAVGGRQSARTIHFFDAIALTVFVIVHVVMVARCGFLRRTRGMIVGGAKSDESEEELP
ncbi:MAG TPA: cytochrome b/b6 domain-containing protein [Silvibacterium sp.]|nr:cytochrome b/b6 domain-containing protein [Silvibacterium sp.]